MTIYLFCFAEMKCAFYPNKGLIINSMQYHVYMLYQQSQTNLESFIRTCKACQAPARTVWAKGIIVARTWTVMVFHPPSSLRCVLHTHYILRFTIFFNVAMEMCCVHDAGTVPSSIRRCFKQKQEKKRKIIQPISTQVSYLLTALYVHWLPFFIFFSFFYFIFKI